MLKKFFKIFIILIYMLMLSACKNDPQISSDIKNSNIGFDGYVFLNDGVSNKIIKGAKVELLTDVNTLTTYTDDKGYFYFDKDNIKDMKYTLKVITNYFPDFTEEIDFKNYDGSLKFVYIKSNDIKFTASAIIGRVFINGKPASNIDLRMGILKIKTDGYGKFLFNNLSEGVYTVETEAENFVNVAKEFEVKKDTVYVNNVIELYKQKINVYGKVINANTKEPLQNVKVSATINSKYYFFNQITYSDEKGEFYFDGLIEGEYVFSFEKDGFYNKSYTVNIENDTERELLRGVELKEGEASLLLTLYDSATHKPISGVKLIIDGDETRKFYSDSSGRISIYGLTKVTHTLKFTSDFYNVLEKNVDIKENINSQEYYLIPKVDAAKIYGNVFTEDSGEIWELNISNDNKELINFNLYYVTQDGEKRIAPYSAVRGQQTNQYVFSNIASGRYIFEPTLIVDSNSAILGKRSSGVYTTEPIEIIINTGEEIRIDLLLKKNSGDNTDTADNTDGGDTQ